MKKTAFIFLTLLNSLHIFGQYLIIEDSIQGGSSITLQDTIIDNDPCWFGSPTTYPIDLDQDSTSDIIITAYCELGGQIDLKKLSISTLNDFNVHVDTNYIDSSYYDWYDSTILIEILNRTVVKRYNPGDTVYPFQESTSSDTYVSYLFHTWDAGGGPLVVHGNVNHFVGDTCYFALTKNNGQFVSIYYLKVSAGYSNIHLFSAKSNDSLVSNINERKLLSDFIYPNPVKDNITFNRNFHYFEVYTLHGLLVLSGNIEKYQRTIDVSQIPRGYYFLKFHSENTKFVTKFIKL
jgi:hypothetical protein